MKEVLYTEEAEEFARGLPRIARAKLVATVAILERQGFLNKPLAEKVEGHENLFAITIHTRENPRVFYAYDAGTVVWLLNGYYKKSMRIPEREIAKAEAVKRRLGL